MKMTVRAMDIANDIIKTL